MRGEEARGRLVRLARPDHDARQPNADAVEKAAAGVIGEQELDRRLLRAVGRQRREVEFVADRRRKRRAEHRDRRGEDEPRSIAVADRADRLEQRARAVEIDPHALLEIEFGLAGDHAGKMEDHVGRPATAAAHGADRRYRRRGLRLCRRNAPALAGRRRRSASACRSARPLSVPSRDKPRRQLAADHAGGASDQNVHQGLPLSMSWSAKADHPVVTALASLIAEQISNSSGYWIVRFRGR